MERPSEVDPPIDQTLQHISTHPNLKNSLPVLNCILILPSSYIRTKGTTMERLLALMTSLLLVGSTFAQKGFTETSLAYQSSPKTYQKVSIPIDTSPTAHSVKVAILERIGWLEGKGFDLVLNYERESPHSFHFTYDQSWKGLPVYHHNIKANVSRNGIIYSFLNNLLDFDDQVEVLGGFTASETEAISHLSGQYLIPLSTMETELIRCYFPRDGALIPAYQIRYSYGESWWESILDARQLNTLVRRDLASYRQQFLSTGDTIGTGLVFNPDPLTTSGFVYGSTSDWIDNNDADNSALNNQRIQVNLRDICYTGGQFHLKGPHVDLQDVENPTSPIATSPDGVFNYTRSQQGFEDVMCYYHIDTFQRYIQSLGYTNLYNSPLICDPHGLNGSDQSHFVPQGSSTRIAFGEGCVDDAEDADVILHEYGHALSWSAAPNSNSGTERQGIDEGIGDYLSTSYSKGISPTFWEKMFTWDGHNECWAGRSASTSMTYPPTSSFNIYDYGEIWNTCLMEVYDNIGRDANDRVVLQSLYGNNLNMTLSDAARVVIEADSIIFGGIHKAQYQIAFCNRGVLSGSECIVARVDPDLNLPQWDLFPNPAHSQLSIRFTALTGPQQLQYSIVNSMGQVLQAGDLAHNTTVIGIENLCPGFYSVNIMAGSQSADSRKFSVIR